MIFHRMIAHRAFKLRSPLKEIMVIISLPAGTPIQWAGNHRQHHRATDTAEDPHSPYFGGFWHAHCGWYLESPSTLRAVLYAFAGPLRTLFDAWHRPRSNQQHVQYARDISDDRFMNWVSQAHVYGALMIAQVLLMLLFFGYFWGTAGLVAYYLGMIVVYNLGDSIDSFAHLFGARNPNSPNQARNSMLMAIICGGEGWHANHHEKPATSKIGRGFQIDPVWYFIWILQKLNLAYEVK